MAINMNFIKKTSIKIYFDKNCLTEVDFKELMLGIEEEGIPYEVHGLDNKDAVELGYQASIESKLGVGLGVSKEMIVLHYNKLEENSPLYKISTKSNDAKLRALGSNAARLVVKMPFKEI